MELTTQIIERLKMQEVNAAEYNGKYPVVFPMPECLKKTYEPGFNDYESDPKGTLINEDGTANIDVIRYELQWDAFDMTGYAANMECDRQNNELLERFRKYGIFNRLAFYYIAAYKGTMFFYYLPWKQQSFDCDRSMEQCMVIRFDGDGTEEILNSIFTAVYSCWEGNYRRLG
jgi:hypothetical protein